MAKKTQKAEPIYRRNIQAEIIMLRTQGFTVRQICSILQIKSKNTVLNQIKEYLENNEKQEDIGVREYKDLELNRCDERFGRLAEWRKKIETMDIPIERKLSLMLALEDK